MQNLQHLITTKQFYAAAWKVIDARGPMATPNTETVKLVSEIIGKAVAKNCAGEVRKIMKAFDKWVDQEASELAVTLLNETTDIDLQPDEL